MKKLLMGSTVLAISTIGLSYSANAQNGIIDSNEIMTNVIQEVNTLTIATDLQHGDFQSTARTETGDIHTGFGAALMGTVRLLNY